MRERVGAALAAALSHIPPNRAARRAKKLETPVSADMVETMSIAELKHFADKLSAKERTWLWTYLFAQQRASAPGWRVEMARRRRRLAIGKGINSSEYRRRLNSA